MGAIKQSIIEIGTGLYNSAVEPDVIMVRPDEILASRGLPVTQENCAALYASLALNIAEGGHKPVLVECLDAPSNINYLASHKY